MARTKNEARRGRGGRGRPLPNPEPSESPQSSRSSIPSAHSPSQSPEPEVQPQAQPQGLHPLLTMNDDHKFDKIKKGEKISKLVVRHPYHFVAWNDRYDPLLKASGFYGVHQIGNINWDDNLICALVERWRPETHTFHMAVGEMTITLQDVALLLGLPIDGTAVCYTTKLDWPATVEQYLGVRPGAGAMANKSALKMTWLRDTFDLLPENADEATVHCHFRAGAMANKSAPLSIRSRYSHVSST